MVNLTHPTRARRGKRYSAHNGILAPNAHLSRWLAPEFGSHPALARPIQASGSSSPRQTIAQALAMPGIEDIDFDPPRLDLILQPSLLR